jgi:carotenoid 1,2-hydratase
MTDRGRAALRRSDTEFQVGPSRMIWRGNQLVIDIDEVSSLPLVSRVRGTITVTPSGITSVEAPLHKGDRHIWRPFAPTARIDVDLNRGWRFSGHGYFDANFGTAALEEDFSYWTWGRYPLPDGTACFYDAARRDGQRLELAARFDAEGRIVPMQAPPPAPVRRSGWGVRRETRADTGTRPHQIKAMLDAPFYTRSVVETSIGGVRTAGVHEALDLDRFASPWLKYLLAVRVPRRAGWTWRTPQQDGAK